MKQVLISILILITVPLSAVCGDLIRIGIHVPQNSVLLKQSQQYADILTETIGKDLKIKLVALPLDRIVVYFKMNKLDGDWGVGVDKYKNTPHAVKVPEPLSYSRIIAISRQNFPLDGWKSLKGKSVVYRRGVKVISENIPSNVSAVYKVSAGKQGLEMVQYERVDLYIDFSVPIDVLCSSYHCGQKGISKLSPPLSVSPLYIYLNKRFERWTTDLSKALLSVNQRLKSGELTIK